MSRGKALFSLVWLWGVCLIFGGCRSAGPVPEEQPRTKVQAEEQPQQAPSEVQQNLTGAMKPEAEKPQVSPEPAPASQPSQPQAQSQGKPLQEKKPPQQKKPLQKKTPEIEELTITDKELEGFAADLVAALNDGAGEAFCFTADDLVELWTPAMASIVRMGRLAWLQHLEEDLHNAKLKYVGIEKGSDFDITTTTPGKRSPYRIEVPLVKNLRIQITVNGNPRALVVDLAYRLPAGWRVFKAHLED